MNLTQAKKFLKDNKVKYVLAQFVNIHGVAKTKVVPSAHFDMVAKKGAGFAGFAIGGMGMGPHGPDFMAKADLDTLTMLPWMPGYARVICDGHVDDKPYRYDSRVVLKQRLAELKQQGLTLYTGIEPEFMLFKRDANGKIVLHDDTDRLDKPCYDYKGLSRSAAFLEQLTEALEPMGLDIFQIDHEDANGQFEINFEYSDALTSVDRYIAFKMAASEIAYRLGMICSFMPKPFSDRTGQGTHFHMSMSDAKGKMLFYDDKDKNGLGLSKTGYHFMAGLMTHARAITAVAAPTVNSYKRLVLGDTRSGSTWAPAYVAYGNNNRTACVRVPYGRLELRLPDGSCNPYLTTAAMIAAGMDGVKRKLDPGPPINENLYAWSPEKIAKHGIQILPQTLHEALEAFEADEVVKGALGADLSREFVSIKRKEWIEYSRHVSNWERERYVEFF